MTTEALQALPLEEYLALEEVREILDFLPDAEEALREGRLWNLRPDSIESFDSYVYYCDDCETWHRLYVEKGFLVKDRLLWITVWTVDEDGDWSFEGHFAVGSDEGRDELARDWSYESFRQTWLEYYQWVAEEGDDPLGQFLAPPPLHCLDRVTFAIEEREDGIAAVWIAIDGGERLSRREDVPERIRQYLMLESDDMILKGVTREILEKYGNATDEAGNPRFTVTVEYDAPQRRDTEETKALARREIARIEREIANEQAIAQEEQGGQAQ
jgi:hypothetical protein